MARMLVAFELPGQHPERLEQVTRRLYDELRILGAVRVDRVRESGGEGTKSGLGTALGQLVLSGSFSAATATAVVKVVLANLKRAEARSVALGEGESRAEFTGLTAADQHTLVEAVAARMLQQAAEQDGAGQGGAEDAVTDDSAQ
ncbi:hypothetical protein A8924_6529 [Saccharopolyspora erythraea NRRL 2338]|uniref:Uncharacterized protein n=2 Tax=Saccharopolyspora erythraea TaxID=1836 RepID=A4FMS9_SACEN|nr:hypothetical protein [Saccharopolyspora erythraea]EQD81993.1 hypothetical protein N599_33110 [Saccharopolyspora erythraea D]PFG98999.1 hypothetical protein A8924_6529 [Saccharopolyspora erythraea NRRL 2338]QRK88970.1 hypothetical protein JQX30_30965 [Saccharopolyspora erythraea]CAM05354.1 hypothetical protein SACE_6181 [Saccharopolyspora erythraea NRRL 2338]